MENKLPNLIVTDRDYERISSVLEWQDQEGVDMLWDELTRARVVSQKDLPSDVVTMNSTVVVEDIETNQQRQLKLVYPNQKILRENEVSILAPIGTALIGLRVGQAITWPVPGEKWKKIKVVSIQFQPESEGLFFL